MSPTGREGDEHMQGASLDAKLGWGRYVVVSSCSKWYLGARAIGHKYDSRDRLRN